MINIDYLKNKKSKINLLTQRIFFDKLVFNIKNITKQKYITRIYSEIRSERFYKDAVNILTMSEIIINKHY